MISIKVPSVGESITEVTLLKWTKKEGEWVDRDEVIAELESEKATFEVNAEKAGTLFHKAKEGDSILIGDVLAEIDETAAKPAQAEQPVTNAPVAAPVANQAPVTAVPNQLKTSPVAAAIIADRQVDATQIKASGYAGKIMKTDVLEALSNPGKNAFQGRGTRPKNTSEISANRTSIKM